jgi:hypothetical protein
MSSKDKIQYVKPKVQDLGAVAPVYGGTCSPTGSLNQTGDCGNGGIASAGSCTDGTSASGSGNFCLAGSGYSATR